MAVRLMLGFCWLEEYPLGPFHDQLVTAPTAEELRSNVFPVHRLLELADAFAFVGATAVVTLTDEEELPQPFVAVTM